MKRVILAFAGTVTGLVMLLGFKTQPTTTARTTVPATSTTTGGTGTSGSTGSSSSAGDASSSSGSTASSGSKSTVTATKTVTGEAADTRYGPVQVQITLTNGKVSAVKAVEYPMNDGRDQEINSYAIPQLDQEATSAKSAQIDMVSGATYTSSGYVNSLQSALNKAGLT